jgi:2'-5' RNA ligase
VNSAGSLGRDERIRLFCALSLPDPALSRLEDWQRAALVGAGEARLVPRANLHVTLAFLGHRPVGELEAILGAMRAAAEGAGPIELSVARYRETRSVGMLVFDDREGRAIALANDLHGRLERLGVYVPEKRPWLPHVTVLRFRRPPRLRPPLPDLGPVDPSEAAVYHSVLRSGGAQYDVLESVALGG